MDLAEDLTLVDDGASDQSPSSNAGATSVSAAGTLRKPRVALACQRCKRRKQRCDGTHPICTGCLKANVDCIYERALRPRYPGGKSLYINALEERIAFLEARMPEHGQDHFVSPLVETHSHERPDNPGPQSRQTSSNRQVHRRSVTSVSATESEEPEEQSPLVDGVAYLSLCASGTTDSAPEPFYVGSSSGATIARLIQASIFRAAKPPVNAASRGHAAAPDVLRPSLTDIDRHMSSASGVPVQQPVRDEFPYGPQAQTLFSVFFDRLHTRWPILDRRAFCTVFERQWEQGALPIVQRSILHMVYAISARFLQLMKKNCDVDHERHFAAAIEPMDYILEQHNLATVQFLALLAIYSQRSPYGAGSWSQVRYAITLCIELGLHRRQTQPRASQDQQSLEADAELRKRVFWACYCLDRMTTVTIGRTFAIDDRDINVDLPSDNPEFWYLTAANAEDWHNIRPFIHIIRLRNLQSKVFRTVWRVDKDVLSTTPAEKARLDGKIEKVKRQLDQWVEDIPTPPQGVKGTSWMYEPDASCHDSLDYFNLQYHKTVLSLYTALIPTLPLTDHRFLATTRSAATICTIYKSLNNQKTLSYTVVALHSCFIAGLTLVYCLYRDPSLFEYSCLEATRACSLCLTIFGERFPGAVKYRDIFDAMSGSLLKSIVGGPRRNSHAAEEGPRRPRLDVDMNFNCPPPMPMIPEVAPQGSSGDFMVRDVSGEQSNILFGAVKDAFMEVDEQAAGAGGWQGWRMFNEMVQNDIALAPKTLTAEHEMTMGNDQWQSSFDNPSGFADMSNGFWTSHGMGHG